MDRDKHVGIFPNFAELGFQDNFYGAPALSKIRKSRVKFSNDLWRPIYGLIILQRIFFHGRKFKFVATLKWMEDFRKVKLDFSLIFLTFNLLKYTEPISLTGNWQWINFALSCYYNCLIWPWLDLLSNQAQTPQKKRWKKKQKYWKNFEMIEFFSYFKKSRLIVNTVLWLM